MNSSDPTPQLPAWPFLLIDVALVVAAAFIALTDNPLTVPGILGIVACVGLGAIIGLVPLVARYERQKNAQLDERQRSLEGLTLAASASAEQLSIAANGLNEIAEIAQRSVRHAEHLPHKLQEKIAEFQAQLALAADAEKEELERELLALRTTESERLETVSQRIAKSAAEWVKLEAATQQHLTAAQDALAKLSARATAAAQELDAKIARLEAATRGGESEVVASASAPAVPPAEEIAVPVAADAVAQPPKRPRKIRREEPAPAEPSPAPAASAPADVPAPAAPAEEPPPVPAAKIVEIEPVAPGTSEPFAGHIAAAASVAPVEVSVAPVAAPAVEAPREPRKRAAKKTDEDHGPALDLDESGSTSAASVAERVLTSDGATRLIVTAYIGIGNRLFIRGMGPGLSWEKGVPLQFVSIGKWRWETNDATGPVQFKLYKNDDIECAALGAQALDPGHQQELTAAF